MNGNGYTASDISFIVGAYPKLTVREMATSIGRTYDSLHSFIHALLRKGVIDKVLLCEEHLQ